MGCGAAIVEDQPDVGRLTAVELANAGCIVSVALTVREARDEVLLDSRSRRLLGNVAALDGGFFARDLKERLRQHRPIIIRPVATGTAADLSEGLRGDIDRLLVAPLSRRRSAEQIRVALARAGREAGPPDLPQTTQPDQRAHPYMRAHKL